MRQLFDEATALVEGIAALDRNIDVEPTLAGGFEHRLELEVIEGALEDFRHGDDIFEGRPFGRVQVDHGPIGVLGLVLPRVPGMHVDHRVVR